MTPSEDSQNSQLIVQLTSTVEVVVGLVTSLIKSQQTNVANFGNFQKALTPLKKSMDKLNKILLEGNGSEALVVRQARTEERLEALEEDIHERKKQENTLEVISRKGKWAIVVALASGFLALVVALVK